METKVCKVCGEQKSIDAFEIGRNTCKECRKKYHAEYWQKYIEIKNPGLHERREIRIKENAIRKIERSKIKEQKKEIRISKKNAEYKICISCGEVKNRDSFYINKTGGWLRSYCKKCECKINQQYISNNIIQYKETQRKYHKKKMQNMTALERSEFNKYKKLHMSNEAKKRRRKRERYNQKINLANSYVKKVLSKELKLKHIEIPKEFVEVKKIILKINRHEKECN